MLAVQVSGWAQIFRDVKVTKIRREHRPIWLVTVSCLPGIFAGHVATDGRKSRP